MNADPVNAADPNCVRSIVALGGNELFVSNKQNSNKIKSCLFFHLLDLKWFCTVLFIAHSTSVVRTFVFGTSYSVILELMIFNRKLGT